MIEYLLPGAFEQGSKLKLRTVYLTAKERVGILHRVVTASEAVAPLRISEDIIALLSSTL